jgi:outer membrane protein TolC
MKKGLYGKLFSTLIALGSWFALNSQQYSDSLLKYLEIAAKKNPAVLQRYAEYQAALKKIPQVGTLSDPELSLGVFIKPMELISGNQVADIKLMQMFPWFGVLRNARDEMSLMANAKYEIFHDAKLQTFYDVQRTWYNLYKIRKDITISERNIEILKTIERLALVRYKSASPGKTGEIPSSAGMSPGNNKADIAGSVGMKSMDAGLKNPDSPLSDKPAGSMQTASMGSSSGSVGLSDLYRIGMETGELESDIASLKDQEQTVILVFNNYLNRLPVSPVFTGEFLVPDSLGLSLLVIHDSLLTKNPMLSMLEFENQSFEARKKMATAMGYPMVGLGVSYSLIEKNEMSTSSMKGKDMVMPMVTVTLPIYRKKYRSMISEAHHMKTASSLNYQAAVNSLKTEYYQAVQFYHDSQRRMRLYENQYQLASKSLDLEIKSFSSSASGLSEVLRAQQQMLGYELKKVEALSDFNTAVALLNRLMAISHIQ